MSSTEWNGQGHMLRRTMGLLVLFCWSVGSWGADEVQDALRALVGAKVFAMALSAEERPEHPVTAGGRLPVWLVTASGTCINRDELLGRFETLPPINGHRLSVEEIQLENLMKETRVPAALFVCERLSDFTAVLSFAQRNRLLLFSPFLGDVKRGAPLGLHVGDRLTPVVRAKQLARWGIQLKGIFLSVAEEVDAE